MTPRIRDPIAPVPAAWIAAALAQREENDLRPETIFQTAEQWARQIDVDASGRAITSLVCRVDLKLDGFLITIQLPLGTAHLELTRFVPMQMKRRGVELKMIFGGKPSKADPTLLKAVARGHRWFDALKAGKLVPDIAKEEGIQIGYVRRILQLAFLAPSIVEAIINGTHPPDLTTQKLTWTRLDADWQTQRQQLGFA